MNERSRIRTVQAIAAATVDDGTFTAIPIDTRGYNEAYFVFQLGATDIAMTALKLQESDTSGGTYTDVPGAAFGATGAPALPTANDDGNSFQINLRLDGRKPFLRLLATAGNGSTGVAAYAYAVLLSPSVWPQTAAERGVTSQINVLSVG